jgi:hypothetical protein
MRVASTFGRRADAAFTLYCAVRAFGDKICHHRGRPKAELRCDHGREHFDRLQCLGRQSGNLVEPRNAVPVEQEDLIRPIGRAASLRYSLDQLTNAGCAYCANFCGI